MWNSIETTNALNSLQPLQLYAYFGLFDLPRREAPIRVEPWSPTTEHHHPSLIHQSFFRVVRGFVELFTGGGDQSPRTDASPNNQMHFSREDKETDFQRCLIVSPIEGLISSGIRFIKELSGLINWLRRHNVDTRFFAEVYESSLLRIVFTSTMAPYGSPLVAAAFLGGAPSLSVLVAMGATVNEQSWGQYGSAFIGSGLCKQDRMCLGAPQS